MLKDFDLIVNKFGTDVPYINVYPLGDLHIGSPDFNESAFRRWKNEVDNDPYAKVVLVGDMMDNGLKNSVTNTYEATMTPFQQKEWLKNELETIKDKIIGAVQGNHEYRDNILTGICPLYDVMAKLDLEHLYRPNMTFMKLNLGQRTKDRQCSYNLVVAHGATKGRTKQFPYTIDGVDVMITGHFHTPESYFRSKIVIDSKNESVTMRDFMHISVPSFTSFGGYALRAMYIPQDGNIFPVVRLDGTKKETKLIWM